MEAGHEMTPWKRRIREDRCITKEDLRCFRKASVQRAVFLAQVGHGDVPPINEIFAVKSYAGRSKCKSTLYRIRNLLALFNTVFRGRFDYLNEFVELMGKQGTNALAENGSWCELGDFFSKASSRDALKGSFWPEGKTQFLKEWNDFRRYRIRQRPTTASANAASGDENQTPASTNS